MKRQIFHCGPVKRRGTSSFDLLTAFTLLMSAMTVATPLVVRHNRLLKTHRDYRIALDELTNQLELLTVLPADQIPGAVANLKPSEFSAKRLPKAALKGDLQQADGGLRVVLSITWHEVGRDKAPVSLAAWIFPPPTAVPPAGGQP